jgi:hypothetical protein
MKVTTTAWLGSHHNYSPEDLHNATADKLTDILMFRAGDTKIMVDLGMTQVGTATIEIQLAPKNDMVVNKIEALRAEMQSVKAESQKKVQDIAVKIQNLLAIEVSK